MYQYFPLLFLCHKAHTLVQFTFISNSLIGHFKPEYPSFLGVLVFVIIIVMGCYKWRLVLTNLSSILLFTGNDLILCKASDVVSPRELHSWPGYINTRISTGVFPMDSIPNCYNFLVFLTEPFVWASQCDLHT